MARYSKIVLEQGRLSNDPVQLIKEWWISEDDQVEKWLNEICDHVQRGIYSTILYPEIVKQISIIKAYGVKIECCDGIIKAMKCYIQSTDAQKLVGFEREHFIPDVESAEIYNQTMHELNELMDSRLKQSEKKRYQDMLNAEDWTERLRTKERRIWGHSFVYWLDVSEIVEKIKTCNNRESQAFRDSLLSVYSGYTFYEQVQDDYEHLSELKSEIEKLMNVEESAIKKLSLKWMAGDIGRYLEQIKAKSGII